MITSETKIGELVQVRLVFADHSIVAYLIQEPDLNDFLLATYQLHSDPGFNPHSGMKAAKVIRFDVSKFSQYLSKAYWWTTVNLEYLNKAAVNAPPSKAVQICSFEESIDSYTPEEWYKNYMGTPETV